MYCFAMSSAHIFCRLCTGVVQVLLLRRWHHDLSLVISQVSAEDAEALVKAGAKIVAEGANMPSDPEAIQIYHEKGVEFGPAKVHVL